MASAGHSRTSHVEKLNLLCRFCGERSKDWKLKRQPVLCENYADDIAKVYNINVKNDSDGVHSKTMCRNCYLRLQNIMRTGKTPETVCLDIQRSSVLWTEFDGDASVSSCIVCSTYEKQAKGRRQKIKHLGFKPIASPVCQSQTTDTSDISGNVHDDSSNVDVWCVRTMQGHRLQEHHHPHSRLTSI